MGIFLHHLGLETVHGNGTFWNCKTMERVRYFALRQRQRRGQGRVFVCHGLFLGSCERPKKKELDNKQGRHGDSTGTSGQVE
uniref:Uncharacterized protein n=1 Tax=Hyaloperonospora arabidopsidis (strain Emoy2) TaxID=559515 RepID=M4C351_HYAAE